MADISRIKLANGSYVNLKDATARSNISTMLGSHALEALGAAAWKALASEISASDAGLPTAAQVKSYVDSQVATIPEFDVVVVGSGEDLPTASASTFHKIYLKSAASPSAPNLYVEYITVRSGVEGSYTYGWEQIGDTALDLSGYVPNTRTVAGIALSADISVEALQTALGLGEMAYADTASGSGSVNTIDTITMNAVTVAGNATVTSTATAATLTKGNYTPAGSITGAAISGGSINVTLADAASESAATLTRADYTPTGDVTVTLKNNSVLASVATAGTLPSKAADTFTANTPTAIDVSKFNGGSAASWTGATHTAASLGNATKSAFATEGVVAAVGTGDDAETLIFTAAGTSNAVTEQGTFTPDTVNFGTFSGGSAASLGAGFYTAGTAATFTEGAFSAGAMPTFTEGTVGVDTASFAGDEVKNFQVTGVGYTKQVVDTKTFTPTAATLGFSGTEAENILVTGVTYDKADATAAFSESVTPTVNAYNRTAKTVDVTVNPD